MHDCLVIFVLAMYRSVPTVCAISPIVSSCHLYAVVVTMFVQRLSSVISQVKVSKDQELLQSEVLLAVRMGGLNSDNAVVLEGQALLKALAAEKALIAQLAEATASASTQQDADHLTAKLREAEAAGVDENHQVVQDAKRVIKTIESMSETNAAEKRLKKAFEDVSLKVVNCINSLESYSVSLKMT